MCNKLLINIDKKKARIKCMLVACYASINVVHIHVQESPNRQMSSSAGGGEGGRGRQCRARAMRRGGTAMTRASTISTRAASSPQLALLIDHFRSSCYRAARKSGVGQYIITQG